MPDDPMVNLGVDLIPEPRTWSPTDTMFALGDSVQIEIPEAPEVGDQFAAADLAAALREEWDIDVSIGSPGAIRLQRQTGVAARAEGYQLDVTAAGVTIRGYDAAGLFWGTRTLLQAIRRGAEGPEIPGLSIVDWPAVQLRAMHYDTKHHQGSFAYVQGLIRRLSRYKANALVWEWEDKLAYESHPEIGAPGAFTKQQMQELTAYGRQYHVQIIPLVQGLGHVSYILKHPALRHLREIPDSSWEFCPLNDATYELLFDLWDEAMEATPGSDFCHIGSDETYELGLGEVCGCRAKAAEVGRDGLMKIFLDRCVAHVESRGRRAIAWTALGKQGEAAHPPKGLLLTPTVGGDDLQRATDEGFDSIVYAPNPGIEPLHLPYFPWVQHSMWRDDIRRVREGSFRDTAQMISAAAKTGCVIGSITTSWDDSGLHSQAWMPRWVCASEYSWNADGADVDVWVERFFREYFGPTSRAHRELYDILQDGGVFYYHTFQRSVWHWGVEGKIHLPDFPRTELEYNPFWQRRYAQLLHRAAEQKQRLARALRIIDDNLENQSLRNRYDFELYRTITELMRHNADLILMLGRLEGAITAAHQTNYSDRAASLGQLERAGQMIEEHLHDRRQVYDTLVEVWERTRLPKGMSTQDKPYVFAPDRARHLANRTADMKYLIVDEELLDLEGYLERLSSYIDDYRQNLAR